MAAPAPPLRPLAVSDLFDETIRMYRQLFGLLVALTAFTYLPVLVFVALGGATMFALATVRASPTPAQLVRFAGIGLIAVLVGVITYPVGVAGTIHAISSARFGRRLGVSEAIRLGFHRYWGFVWLQ